MKAIGLLHGTGQQAAHEIALHREEHHQRHRDRDEGRGGEDFPVAAARADQLDDLAWS
jgi:hypothetical protein